MSWSLIDMLFKSRSEVADLLFEGVEVQFCDIFELIGGVPENVISISNAS